MYFSLVLMSCGLMFLYLYNTSPEESNEEIYNQTLSRNLHTKTEVLSLEGEDIPPAPTPMKITNNHFDVEIWLIDFLNLDFSKLIVTDLNGNSMEDFNIHLVRSKRVDLERIKEKYPCAEFPKGILECYKLVINFYIGSSVTDRTFNIMYYHPEEGHKTLRRLRAVREGNTFALEDCEKNKGNSIKCRLIRNDSEKIAPFFRIVH